LGREEGAKKEKMPEIKIMGVAPYWTQSVVIVIVYILYYRILKSALVKYNIPLRIITQLKG
jgi:hypothetical protein